MAEFAPQRDVRTMQSDIAVLKDRLNAFIAAWPTKNQQSLYLGLQFRLSRFFDEWRRIAPETFIMASEYVQTTDILKFKEFAFKFKPIFIEYRMSGVHFNPWQAAGVGRDELRNCRLLSLFIDHAEDHGQGPALLCNFLESIGLGNLARHASQAQYKTRTEVWPLDDRESRIDIEIDDSRFLIFIEAKIASGEGRNQLQRYVELARLKADGRPWAVVYLTPKGRSVENDRVTPASWNQVSGAVKSCIKIQNSVIGHMMSSYADYLACL